MAHLHEPFSNEIVIEGHGEPQIQKGYDYYDEEFIEEEESEEEILGDNDEFGDYGVEDDVGSSGKF